MHRWPIPALVPLLWACGGIEDQGLYAEARADAECRQLERCSLGFYESEYRDHEDCVDERAELIEDTNDVLDDQDCDYVPEEAGACVSRTRNLSCEEWAEGEAYAACDLVWDCLGG